MIRALTPVARILFLRGLMKVQAIDFPATDEARFRAYVNDGTAAFIAPNHPEFLTDWLLDKELSVRHAPLMASWATHEVVNGMGAAMQWFWSSNNLIAQIPGAGGAAGKNHSVGWALQGHAVLLHPERPGMPIRPGGRTTCMPQCWNGTSGNGTCRSPQASRSSRASGRCWRR